MRTRTADKSGRLTFLRVVEVFSPLLREGERAPANLKALVKRFRSETRRIRDYCDVVLVADLKNPGILRFSTVEAAALLERGAGVKAAPVIVARDANRPRILADITTAFGLGIRNIMLAWGDPRPTSSGTKNVYDFPNLSALIREARAISERAGAKARIFAPVSLESLTTPRGVGVAKSRLAAGADLLLAQPPTTDSGDVLESHRSIIQSAGLAQNVLPGVFPFRSREDVEECSRFFGWSLPQSLYIQADEGEEALLAQAKEVAKKVGELGFPGVYVSTRGTPSVAGSLLNFSRGKS